MPIPERPLFDTVFPRDLYISVGDRGVMMSKMRALHRKDEPAFARSFLEAKLGLNVLGTMPYHFEGDSCLFELPNRQAIVFGHGSRADQRAGDVLRELFGIPVISVGLVEQFFHLDTAGTALSGRDPAVIFCREALSDPSAWEQLERACAEDGSRLIPLSIDDAVRYGSNVRVIDGSLVAPPGLSSSYWDTMGSLGYTPHVIGLGPLHVECGGFVACATNHFPSSFEEATIPDDCRWDVVRSSIVNSVHDYPTEEIV